MASARDLEKGQGLDFMADHRALLEGLFLESPVAFQVYRADGHCLLVNRAFRELFGAEPPPEYSIFEDDVLERQGFLGLVKKAFGGETVRVPPHWYDPRELRQLEVQQGRRVGIEVTLFPLRSSAGAVEHVALCFKDVTAELERGRERDELGSTAEALRRREEELATILDGIGDAVVATDTRGRILRMNSVAERLSGWVAAEAEGSHFSDVFRIIDEVKREVVHDPVERVLAEGSVVGLASHGILVTREGKLRVIADSGAPIRDAQGNARGVVMVFRDETTKRASDRALRESEERFRATFEQLAVGVAHVATNGRWLEVNRRLADIVGYTREELLERTFQDITYPPDLEADLESMRQMLSGELSSYSLEKRYVRKDDSLVWIELTVSLVRDALGEPKYFISVVQDIDSRKKAERLIDEIADQLRQAQKMEAVGRLAGGVAHDFNNTLSIILGHGELVMQRLAPGDPTREDVKEVTTAAERAASLTRQLLAFSRQQVLEPKVIDLNAVLREMYKMLARLIGEDVEIRTLTEPGLGSVLVDRTQFEQVLLNLVVNARDAMPLGGTLTLETANVEFDAAYVVEHPEASLGAHVMLAVTDTGIGMDPETSSRIFEPFFTTKDRDKGTGLGLAMVFGTVAQSGGHISVQSEPGRGTVFRLYFPRTNAKPQVEHVRTVAPVNLHGTETVLLVEDDEQVRRVVSQMLRRYGYHVHEARSADDALRVIETVQGIHLLLTDVVMPRTSGPELARRIGSRCPGLKVVYMSGYPDDAVVRHGTFDAGAAFLQKPMTPVSLARKVREVLEAP
jgi:two-component system, cell cycle sensor histidine kinase and response regulator CckA